MLHNSLESEKTSQEKKPDIKPLSPHPHISLGKRILSEISLLDGKNISDDTAIKLKEKVDDYLNKSDAHAFPFAQAIVNLRQLGLYTENNIDNLFHNVQHAYSIHIILTFFLLNSVCKDQSSYDLIMKHVEHSSEVSELIEMLSLMKRLSKSNLDGVMTYRDYLKDIIKHINKTHVISTENINQAIEDINITLAKDGKPIPPRVKDTNMSTLPGFFNYPKGYKHTDITKEDTHTPKPK